MKEEKSQLYERAIDKMDENRTKILSGGVNCIPTSFKRLSTYWNGVEKGKYYLVTASTGVGKSKLTKKIFVFDMVDQIINHPEWGIDLHIKYFCLEESKVNFMQSLMAYKLYNEGGKRVSVTEMNSIGTIAGQEVIDSARKWSEYWNKFEQIVDVIDDIRNPTGIFKHCEKWLLNNGKWVLAERKFFDPIGSKTYTKLVKDYYMPSHKDRYFMCIVDHISLISTERNSGVMMNLHQSISRLSNEYLLQLRDNYNSSIVVVQQQMAAQEQKQFTYKGQNIESKLEPTIDGLADNKLTARDADIIKGLFAPERYEIEKHAGYDITKLQDHYRSLKIIKHRDGTSNVKIGLFFDGATGVFNELPKSSAIEEEDYFILRKIVGLV